MLHTIPTLAERSPTTRWTDFWIGGAEPVGVPAVPAALGPEEPGVLPSQGDRADAGVWFRAALRPPVLLVWRADREAAPTDAVILAKMPVVLGRQWWAMR